MNLNEMNLQECIKKHCKIGIPYTRGVKNDKN